MNEAKTRAPVFARVVSEVKPNVTRVVNADYIFALPRERQVEYWIWDNTREVIAPILSRVVSEIEEEFES